MIRMTRDGEWLTGQLETPQPELTYGDLLREQWGLPKKMAHLLFQHKEVLLNDQPINQNHKVTETGTLRMRVCLPEEYGVEPKVTNLEILYEDDHVLIVNKPAGMLLHPTESSHTETLDHYIAGLLQQQGIQAKVRHVHRLDQDTSGAVLYAKHALASSLLDEMLRHRKISRMYMAVVQGKIPQDTGKIDAPIGRDRHHPSRRRVTPQGEHAVTLYRVIKRFPYATQVECSLETGRTHQIRVHLSHLGFPLVGDTLYGGKKNGISRQALHAFKLSLIHPFGEEKITVEAPMPQELQQLISRLS
ncbi:RluA family pseudouridine synthase [Brevibacillus sp. SYSU BS000544]|uniref:RluA family pseudouridine synthase n=1 Tax=Brevibacillus sp. SYSU BS000544 TaxID=3416443 RepID=UPI003CE50D4F